MEDWNEIRHRVLVEGKSKRSVCREFGLHWDTLRKILEHSEPPGYRMQQPRKKRMLEAFQPIIEQILRDDRSMPRKQRHTAQRIFDRLGKENGYEGGLTIVKDAVRAWHRHQAEVFVPLSHPPGEAQVDFGEGDIILKGVQTTVAFLVMSLPYSDAFFCCAFPRECTEAFLEGHRLAFAFFAGVPRRISYDNSRIAVKRIMGPRERELTTEFLRLQSHYLFVHHFCLVRRANEKGHVENLIGFARRNFLVPLPRVDNFETLNQQLEEACRQDQQRIVRGQAETKAQLLAQEQSAFLPLPAGSFEARRVRTAVANSLSLVRFHGNDYSVPTAYAYHDLTVVGTIEQVRILFADQVVATHSRHWGKAQVEFDPLHYLALLERKPGALDFARPLENWLLPECFGVLRRRLENELAGLGTRQFIKVLRLLEGSSVRQVADAVEQALAIHTLSVDAIRLILQQRQEKPVGLFCLDGRPHLKSVQVQTPDLRAYRCLLAGGAA
ncbi:MAG: IS21 family transposase [Planctomycetota bacterium]|nr:IS21 family transposase [Planctomycetota bacterium]